MADVLTPEDVKIYEDLVFKRDTVYHKIKPIQHEISRLHHEVNVLNDKIHHLSQKVEAERGGEEWLHLKNEIARLGHLGAGKLAVLRPIHIPEPLPVKVPVKIYVPKLSVWERIIKFIHGLFSG